MQIRLVNLRIFLVLRFKFRFPCLIKAGGGILKLYDMHSTLGSTTS